MDPLPTFVTAYPIDFILFLAWCIPYYSGFCFWLIFVTYVAYSGIQSLELHVLHCPVNIIRVKQQSVNKWREINN